MVILGLGSNTGDRLGYLQAAVNSLSHVLADVRLSRIYESAALLPADATPDMDRPFLNMVVSGTCGLSAEDLFITVKTIEKDLGRIHRAIWGPREIDIDILAMDDWVLDTEHLHIPHPGMLQRDFVMLPMLDVVPDWQYPVAGRFYHERVEAIVAACGYALSPKLMLTSHTVAAHA